MVRARALTAVLFLCCTVASMPATAALDLYVAPFGRDSWSGRRGTALPDGSDGPFATLERARAAIRAVKRAGKFPATGANVWLRGGTYTREAPFVLGPEDSGRRGAPIVYRAATGEQVVVTGGRVLRGWKPALDPAVTNLLKVKALGNVWQIDVKAAGVTPVPERYDRTPSLPAKITGIELYADGAPMPLSSWPNDGWAKIAGAPNGQKGDCFSFTDDRPAQWQKTTDAWVHGYWTWDWADSFTKVAAIDRAKRTITTTAPHGVYGYSAGRRWRAVNLLEEIDAPGEWCVDRSAGLLYFWPPKPVADMAVVATSYDQPLVSIRGACDVTLQGITFEYGLGAGIEIVGSSRDTVEGCRVRNFGTYGVWIGNGLEKLAWFDYGNVVWDRNGGDRNSVVSCDLHNLGGGGIVLAGGDRKQLTASGHSALNNHIHHYGRWFRTYRAGISVDGVGMRVANNLIHDAPHQAIFVNGNDNLIELNDIHHVCLETGDAGAFYVGRDWSQRGNIVRHNYFHDLRGEGLPGQSGFSDVMAVYLDDWISGTTVFGNVFVKAGRGVLVGGGRDNLVDNNVFVDCSPAVHIDARGLGWAKYYFDGTETTLFDRLKLVQHTVPPYSTRYPMLAGILADEPAQAKGNRVTRNVCVSGKWLDLLDGLTEKSVTVKDNWTSGDAGFVSVKDRDFRLVKGAPIAKIGFEPIPWELIGLRRAPGGATPPQVEKD